MKTIFRLLLFVATALPAMAYRDLETGTFLTRDPAGFVDGPNLYSYVNQNPWTAFDPEGLDAEKLSNGNYRYTLRPELDPKINPNANYRGGLVTSSVRDKLSGNCAMGAQWTCGTVLKDGVHDVPKASTWTRGDPVTKDTKPGTMVARSWIQDDKGNWIYPSLSIEEFRKAYPDMKINHVGTFESMTKQGNVILQDQFRTSDGNLNSRMHSGLDGWYEVNGSKPYDEQKSDSAIMPHPVDPTVKPNPDEQKNPAPVPDNRNKFSPDSSARQQQQQQQQDNPAPKPVFKLPWNKDKGN